MKLFVKPLLLLTALPAVFGLIAGLGAGFLGYGIIVAGMFILLSLGAAAAVLGALGAIWLLLSLPSYRLFLAAGFGLTLAVGPVLALGGISFPDVWGITLLAAVLVSPLLVGAAVVYGLDTRPKLRWNAELTAALALPLSIWLPQTSRPAFWYNAGWIMILAIAFHLGVTVWVYAAVTAAVLRIPAQPAATR